MTTKSTPRSSEIAPHGRARLSSARLPWPRARSVVLLAAMSGASGVAGPVPAQEASSEVVWDRWLRLPDGRLFVTDGAITLDVELAKPRDLPGNEMPPATGVVMDRYMAAELPNEFRLGDLDRGPHPQTYESPSGVLLAAKYVDLLRRAVPGARLRMGGYLEPVVIVSDGKLVGLVMAMARP